jgi:hypothetical protein
MQKNTQKHIGTFYTVLDIENSRSFEFYKIRSYGTY